jgi:hypothetical protein
MLLVVLEEVTGLRGRDWLDCAPLALKKKGWPPGRQSQSLPSRPQASERIMTIMSTSRSTVVALARPSTRLSGFESRVRG